MIKKLILLSYNLVWTILFIICMFRVIVSMTDYLVKLIKKIKTIINFNKLDMCYMLYLLVSFVTSYYICNIIDATKDKDIGAEGYLIFFNSITNININYSIFLHTLTIYCIFICLFGISIKVFLLVNKARFIVVIIAQTVVPVVVVHLIGIFLTKQYGYVVYFVESLVLLCICIYYSLMKISELKERYKLKYNYDDTKEKISEISLEPIKSIDEDKLNFKPLVNIAYDYIMEKDSNENEKYIKPKSISIEGAWGIGKTSLVNLIIERLNYHSCDEGKIRYWQVFRIDSAHLQKYKGSLSVAFYDKLISTSNNSLKYFFESLILEYKQNWLNSFRLLFRVDNDEIVEYINYELVVNQIGAIFVIDDLDRLDKEDIKNIIALVSEKIKIEFKKNVVMMLCFSRINLEKSLNTNLDAYNEFYLSKYSEMNLAIPDAKVDDYAIVCLNWFEEFIKNQDEAKEKLTNSEYSWLYIRNLAISDDYSNYLENVKKSFSQIFCKIKIDSVRELKKILKNFEISYLINKKNGSFLELNFFYAFLIYLIRFYSESVYRNLNEIIDINVFPKNGEDFNKLNSKLISNYLKDKIRDSDILIKVSSVFDVLTLFSFQETANIKIDRANEPLFYIEDKAFLEDIINIYSFRFDNNYINIDNLIKITHTLDYKKNLEKYSGLDTYASHIFFSSILLFTSKLREVDIKLISAIFCCMILSGTGFRFLRVYCDGVNLYSDNIFIKLEQAFKQQNQDCSKQDCSKNDYFDLNDDDAKVLFYRLLMLYETFDIKAYKNKYSFLLSIKDLCNIKDNLIEILGEKAEDIDFLFKIFKTNNDFVDEVFKELFNSSLSVFTESVMKYKVENYELNIETIVSNLIFVNQPLSLVKGQQIKYYSINLRSFQIVLFIMLNFIRIHNKNKKYTNDSFDINALSFVYLVYRENIKFKIELNKQDHALILQQFFKKFQENGEFDNELTINGKSYTVNKEESLILKKIYKIIYDCDQNSSDTN